MKAYQIKRHLVEKSKKLKRRKMPVSKAFWQEWRKDKESMKAAGFRVNKNSDGNWEVWLITR